MKSLKRGLLAVGAIVALVSCQPKSNGEGAGRAEFDAAAVGDNVTVETYIQAKSYKSSYKNVNLYCQDKDGAYYAYRVPCTDEEYDTYKIGSKIKLTGEKTEWAGWVEFAEGTCTVEVLDGSWTAKATDVTSSFATDLKPYQNMFVAMKGLTVEESVTGDGWTYAWNGSGEEGDDLYYFVSYEGQKYQFTVETDLCNKDTQVYKDLKTIKVGDKVNLEGYLCWYSGQPNLHTTSVKVVG